MPTLRVPPSLSASPSNFHAPSSISNTLHVADPNLVRRGFVGEGHPAADIAVVFRAAHPEATFGHRTARLSIAGERCSGQCSEKGGGEGGAHYRREPRPPGECEADRQRAWAVNSQTGGH